MEMGQLRSRNFKKRHKKTFIKKSIIIIFLILIPEKGLSAQ